MAEFDQLLKEIMGDSWDKFSTFRDDQKGRMNQKIRELARAALHEDLTRMNNEIADLRKRMEQMEADRAETAAERVEPNF